MTRRLSGEAGEHGERRTGPHAVAVDGKTSRGERRVEGTRVHLLGVVEHDGGHLVDHVEVDVKSDFRWQENTDLLALTVRRMFGYALRHDCDGASGRDQGSRG